MPEVALRRIARAALVVFAAALAFGLWSSPRGAEPALACAFLRTPQTYEADRSRQAYMDVIDAAAVNALFPGDPFFGLPTVEVGTRSNRSDSTIRQVPVEVLRAIAWVESGITMASRSVAYESSGDALISFDCGHGVMQVTTGMTLPLGPDRRPSATQVSVATHYAYNIARGAAILADKWNRAPQSRPIAGTDTSSSPQLIENWYYAVWSYNGFSGPGSIRSNHPADPVFGGWPRERYRCDGTQARNRYPYQELIWGCMARPPTPNGSPLWTAVDATLPNLSQVGFFEALSVANFRFPYAGMDMPTPQPAHQTDPPSVRRAFRSEVLATPRLSVDAPPIEIRTEGTFEETRATVRIRNSGTGILSWAATPSDGWIVVDPPAGVALGTDVDCSGRGCNREAEITITVNPTLLPGARARGTLLISTPNGQGRDVEVRIDVDADFEVGAPGTSRAY